MENMLNAKAFANAVTAVTAVFYILCLLISYVAPDLLFGIAQSWVHSLSLESLQVKTAISMGSAIWGLITISAMTWVTTYAAIWLYNRWK